MLEHDPRSPGWLSRKDLAEVFRTQILNNKDESLSSPVRTLGSVTFLHLRHNDVHVLCVTRTNANAMMAFSFMTSVRPAVHLTPTILTRSAAAVDPSLQRVFRRCDE